MSTPDTTAAAPISPRITPAPGTTSTNADEASTDAQLEHGHRHEHERGGGQRDAQRQCLHSASTASTVAIASTIQKSRDASKPPTDSSKPLASASRRSQGSNASSQASKRPMEISARKAIRALKWSTISRAKKAQNLTALERVRRATAFFAAAAGGVDPHAISLPEVRQRAGEALHPRAAVDADPLPADPQALQIGRGAGEAAARASAPPPISGHREEDLVTVAHVDGVECPFDVQRHFGGSPLTSRNPTSVSSPYGGPPSLHPG